MSSCPCGSGKEYANCCEIYHSKKEVAPTAEALMRARYCAFVKHEIDYIAGTHAPGTKDFDATDAKRWAEESIWDHLEIVRTKNGGAEDNTGLVEFKAFYADKEKNAYVHHEISTFKKIDNAWFYDDGQIVGSGPLVRETPKVGRNEPCPCNSGKKFKKCCGA